MKHTNFDYDLTRFEADDEYSYVKLAYENNGDKKVLFVLDVMPTEDLHSGKLLSGQTGDLLNVLVATTRRLYAKQAPSFSWLAVTFNAFRTFGKPSEYRAQAEQAFSERVKCLITKYQPDYVVAFGTSVMQALLEDKIVTDGKGKTRFSYWLGVPVKKDIKYKKKVHTTTIVSTLSLNDIVRGDDAEVSLLGYMCRNLSAVYGRHYCVDVDRLHNHKTIMVNTVAKFDKLMAVLREKPYVSWDTEAKNLHKVTNRLLTVQAAFDIDKGYLIPIYHKDTPFTPDELNYIVETLQDYFEGNNNNDYHIYVNAKFDLTLMRAECGIRYFANDVWDILAGEFMLDENLKSLMTVLGEYYYSLGNLSVQYGFDGYITAEFSKQHRANFEATDLSDPAVQHYCTLDVVVPLSIHLQQKERAKYIKYAKYEQVVRNEASDTIHAFSKMEYTGAGLDVPYLFYLKTVDSPIELEIKKMAGALLKTDAVKKTNLLLCKAQGMPTGSLFTGVETVAAFKLNKPDHKKKLFFEVLGLEPLEKGAGGVGKLDKGFQKAYAHIPEVAQYTALEKAKKLKNAYVKSFINMLGSSEDLQKDHRIRPNYGYLGVVTHRGSASDPNLQQVPAHSALGKHIKRLFVAREGTLYIKVDYRVHEVRGWGLISFDKAVAAVFAAAKKLRDEYRLHPTAELAKRLKTEADVHIQNASYFFNVAMEKVDKPLRNAVKGIIFGLIYGMGMKTLAKNIGQTDDFTKTLVDNFAKRFPKAMAWTKNVKKFAAENLFVEAPTGIRRNLFGYLLPSSFESAGQMAARMDRQAGNAPIQGMCSKFMMNGIRILDWLIFKEIKKNKNFMLFITNSVHDSLENEAGYANFLKSLAMIEWALTDGVKNKVKKRYGFDLVSNLEIDFEIGATLSQCEGWDFSIAQLETLVMDSLIFQRNKLQRNIVPDRIMKVIFSDRAVTEDAPEWMQKQISNLNYSFELTERSYIKRMLDEGKAKIAAGEKAMEDVKFVKGDEQKKDATKAAQGKIAEGKDTVEYARELMDYHKQFLNRGE
jgi:DNA polymerase I-like protein with 3'-5' exonuclease and polymerase domains